MPSTLSQCLPSWVGIWHPAVNMYMGSVKAHLQAAFRHRIVLIGTAPLQPVSVTLFQPLAARAGGKKDSAGLSQQAPAAVPGKRARAVEPGSFLNLMINSKHSNGEPFSDLLASSQAFTFLLVSCPSDIAKAQAMPLYC